MIRKRLVELTFTSLALAGFHVWIMPFWENFIATSGRHMGVAELAMGYFIMLLCVWILAGFVTRHMDSGD